MPKVLVVDDSPLMRATIRSMLEENGCEVVGEAVDAKEAVTHFKALNPDLVTLDLILPGDSGLVALRNIRKLNPKANVLVVTATGQDQIDKQAISLGARGVLRKPFDLQELNTAVQKAIGS
ncbi:MAG: response regulator [Elusimicrobia bacterium]|nr:response regulator [Elusimicrobiota bacterium]